MRWFCMCCVAVVLCAAAISADDLPWWKTAVFYQVYPRSFQDSDGDGVGDLKGITQKAKYFHDIGVTAIWLSPILLSPMADFGYDVSDFTAIDPLFGTMEDFKELVQELESLGIQLVMDFVPNHSSDQHPWFLKSLNKTEPYTDYYVWVNGTVNETTGEHIPPNNWMSVFSGSAWKWNNDTRKQFYFHDFLTAQPDLNFRNPAVREEMVKVIRFWLDMGVDGLRLDSGNYLYEAEDINQDEVPMPDTDGKHWKDYIHNLTQNQNETYSLLEDWAMIFYNYTMQNPTKPRALFIETYTDLNHTIRYYGKDKTSLMQPFNFRLLTEGNHSSRAPEIKDIIEEWLEAMPEGDVANWVVGNHDNGRVADRYGHEMVDAINLLTGVLPGVKVVYNGEEIGMQDTFIRWDQTVDNEGIILGPKLYQTASRDPERTPMQWDSSQQSGFSKNASTWLPLNPNYWWLNVEAQLNATSSHLKVFKAMTQARKDPVLQRGSCSVLAPDNDTLVVVRSYNGSSFVLVINMDSVIRHYTSQNLFAANSLDLDMEVVVGSTNYDDHKPGDMLKKTQLSLVLRPKSAVLLKSPPSSSSSALQLISSPILLFLVLAAFWR